MTILEAVKANIGDAHGIQLTENHFIKAILDQDLQPDANYYSLNAEAVDMVTVDLYEKVLGSANLAEGDITYSLRDTEAIKTIIDTLLDKRGKPTRYGKMKSKVTGVSRW